MLAQPPLLQQQSPEAAPPANPANSTDLMRNSSSALNLSALYNMPTMNLQPNYFHSATPTQQQQQQQQQQASLPPPQRIAPPVPVVRVVPPVLPSEPSFDTNFNFGSASNTAGPGWDNPPARPVATSDLNVFEKNSTVVEQALSKEADGLIFTPIVDAKTNSTHSEESEDSSEAAIVEKDEETKPNSSTEAIGPATTSRRGLFSLFRKHDELDASHSPTPEAQPQQQQQQPEAKDPFELEHQRFSGDGQIFKAKLFGFLEVPEARGDKMCQDALQELKLRIRTTGDHKQKIHLQITLDGLKIKDEKSGLCVFHHPIHKISFIVQDLTDSRAFGYVFGSPDKGHRFFGIKTEKASSQVVLAMKDLFQIVFELKKKQVEEIGEGSQDIQQENEKKEETTEPEPSGSFPDGDQQVVQVQEQYNPPSQLMSQLSIETPSQEETRLPVQQQNQSSLSELMGLELSPPPMQDIFQQSFQQQQFGGLQMMNPGSNPFTGQTQAQGYGQDAPMFGSHAQAPVFANQAQLFGNQAPAYGNQVPTNVNQAPFGNQVPYGNQATPIFGHPAQGYGQPASGFAHPNPTNPFQTSPVASGHFGPGSQPLLTTQPLLTSPGFSNAASLSPKYASSSLSPKYGAFDQIANQTKPMGHFGFEDNTKKSTETSAFPDVNNDGMAGIFSSPGLLQPFSSAPKQEAPKPVVASKPVDAFMDLDPLGSGTSKPFVDKKDFFSDRRQPTPMHAPMIPLTQNTESANVTTQPSNSALLDFDLS